LKLHAVRAIAYGGLVVAVGIAFRFVPRLPDSRPANEIRQAVVPSWNQRFDTLARGENLLTLFRRNGLTDTAAGRAAKVAMAVNQGHLAAGMSITIASLLDSAPSDIKLRVAVDRILHLQRHGDTWVGTDDSVPWRTDTIEVGGIIHSNLYAAMDASAVDLLPPAARQHLTEMLADVFEYRIDMSRDLQPGDDFRVVAERSTAPDGSVKINRVLAGGFTLSRSVYKAIRFKSATVEGDFFDQDGKSMRTSFLRAPLEFKRISSGFGMRVHPITGDYRLHAGMDYAAATGTPVRAIGDGEVIDAGWDGGFGNRIKIQHKNGLVTLYGHLSAFATGIRPGLRVHIGQLIGYVGSTGLTTGPHLHFAVYVNGIPRDPSLALSRGGGDPVPRVELAAFLAARDQLLGILDATQIGAATVVAHR